jgi:hypothetical protein
MTDFTHLSLRQNQSRRRTNRTHADNELTRDLSDAYRFLTSFSAEERRLLINFIKSNVKSGDTPIPSSSNVLHFPPPAKS